MEGIELRQGNITFKNWIKGTGAGATVVGSNKMDEEALINEIESDTLINNGHSAINAVELNWNGAQVAGQTVNTTGQLLNLLSVAIEANGAVKDTYYVWFTGKDDSQHAASSVSEDQIANMTLHNTITDVKASIEYYADHEMSMAISKDFTPGERTDQLKEKGFVFDVDEDEQTIGNDFSFKRHIYQLNIKRNEEVFVSAELVRYTTEDTRYEVNYHLESGIRDKFFVTAVAVAGVTLLDKDFQATCTDKSKVAIPAFELTIPADEFLGWTTNKEIADKFNNNDNVTEEDITEATTTSNGFIPNSSTPSTTTRLVDFPTDHPFKRAGAVPGTVQVNALVNHQGIK